MFYIGMAVVIVVLSGLVIWSDELARQQQLEDTIRSTKTRAEDEWDRWAQMVEELITGSLPPKEREERVKQFYRGRTSVPGAGLAWRASASKEKNPRE